MDRLVTDMAAALIHRGPDGSGSWVDSEAGIALGHRRLSIIDLGKTGAQPMASANGRFVISYNGEIYNFKELRGELEAAGHTFRGHSDSEVALEAWSAWGVEEALKRFAGMFAIAVWDREERTLTLARDRLGIKPLYWGRFGDLFLFASELKALRVHSGWAPKMSQEALSSYLRLSCVPAPLSIYQNVFKLNPGSMLTVKLGREPEIRQYWNLDDFTQKNPGTGLSVSDEEAADELEALLKVVVKQHMISDVPLGVFLSGGIDSSAIAAMMQKHSGDRIKTFTIKFGDDNHDESQHAAKIARHLGAEHIELLADPKHALDIIPRLPDIYDEPFADSSQIPTFMVSELARDYATVVLSGDGGDEAFMGYNRHVFAAGPWRWLKHIPRASRGLLALAAGVPSSDRWDRLAGALPGVSRFPQLGEKMHKLAGVLTSDGGKELYQRLVSHGNGSDLLTTGVSDSSEIKWEDASRLGLDDAQCMRYLDTRTYLPDDILTKVDRASMAVGLEVRVPLLDHRIVEFAWSLPPQQLIRAGKGKVVLRQVLDRYIPRNLTERPKQGFAAPIGSWLRGPLQEWAENLLSDAALSEDNIFDPAPIRRLWAEHLAGHRNWQNQLWTVLMVQAWRQRWLHQRRGRR